MKDLVLPLCCLVDASRDADIKDTVVHGISAKMAMRSMAAAIGLLSLRESGTMVQHTFYLVTSCYFLYFLT